MKLLDNIADRILVRRQREPDYKSGFIAKWFVYCQCYPAKTFFQVQWLKHKERRLDKKQRKDN